MSKTSLADIARTLDRLLDGGMTMQARILAHLVAAAETAGHEPARVTEMLDAIASGTVLDEVWVTDESGVAYLTNVRGADGAPVAFRFDPDPAVQPQASAFHKLLASPVERDDVVAQRAQVREIDFEIYKYVGVNGVDRQRIVQVGSALAFEEQATLSNAYTSPVMTAVMAAFGEPDLLSNAHTDRLEEIRTIIEEILGYQLLVQATLADWFVARAEEAGWAAAEIDGRLQRITRPPAGGEIRVLTAGGETVYGSARQAAPEGGLIEGGQRSTVRPAGPRATDGALCKYAAVASAHGSRVAQVGVPLDPASPLSPGFGSLA